MAPPIIAFLAKLLRLLTTQLGHSSVRHVETLIRTAMSSIDTWEYQMQEYANFNLLGPYVDPNVPVVGEHEYGIVPRHIWNALRKTVGDMKAGQDAARAQVSSIF